MANCGGDRNRRSSKCLWDTIGWKGALEDGVEAAEMAAGGEPLYRQVEPANIDAARQ